MVDGMICDKFFEYGKFLSDRDAMLCAILDVRLLGIMNCLSGVKDCDCNGRVTPEELKKAGVLNG